MSQFAPPVRKPAPPPIAGATTAVPRGRRRRRSRRSGDGDASPAQTGEPIDQAAPIGEPDNEFEREADHVADEAVRAAHGRIDHDGGETATPPVARDTPFMRAVLLRARQASGGHPLPEPVRAFMEPRLGASFAQVRVHDDARAADLARSVHAKAFTVGHHVFFKRNEYQPSTERGRRLLAHELTHVGQQSRAGQPAVLQKDEEEVPDLDRSFRDAVDSKDWPQAAEVLNGFSRDDILARIGTMKRGDVAALHQGALDNPRLGPQSQVAELTASAFLDLNFRNEVAKKNWPQAAEFLNAFNREDILARLKKVPADQVPLLHQGALDNPRLGPDAQVTELTGPPEPTAPEPKAPADDVPMGGGAEDFKDNPDYIDNFSTAAFDPFSNTLHLFFGDGGEVTLALPLRDTNTIVLVFERRRSLLDNPRPQDIKIHPSMMNRQTVPNIVGWLTEHREEIGQRALLVQVGLGALQARSIPEDLWWLQLAPVGLIGARFGASRMRPSFGTIEPEPGEIPIIKAPAGATVAAPPLEEPTEATKEVTKPPELKLSGSKENVPQGPHPAETLALETGLRADEAVAVADAMTRHSISSDPSAVRVFTEPEIARFFGVGQRNVQLPEALLQRNDGRFVAVEVKNQNEPDIGSAIRKFETIAGLVENKFGKFRMGRFDLYVKNGFRNFLDRQYSVRADGVLLFNGSPVVIEGAPGVPVIVTEMNLGAPPQQRQ